MFLYFTYPYIYANKDFTTSFIVLPSAAAPIFSLADFITFPISLIVVALTSAIISFTIASISSFDNCFGK